MSEPDSQALPEIDSLWDFNDPKATEMRFRQLLAQARRGTDRHYEAELLTQLARSLGLQQQLDAAHAILDQVEPLLSQTRARVRARYLLERGRMFNSSGFKEKAASLFAQAWDWAQKHGEEDLAVDAAHMVAIARPDESLEWNLRALEVSLHSDLPAARQWQGSLYNNLGWTYFERKQYDSAHRCFEQALTCREARAKPRDLLAARWCLAKCMRFEGKLDSSLAVQRELEQAWLREGEADGFVFEEIAECLLELGRIDESKSYFARAHELLARDSSLTRDEPERLRRLWDHSLP